MDIRQLQYLAALAREKHFTRAAKVCNVTQPTLSGRIRQLEQELGVPIVERGQRFHGLTPEGERVLKWAHAILDNWSSLQQEIATLRNSPGTLAGRLSVGVIPSALPMAALITKVIQDRHPGVEMIVLGYNTPKHNPPAPAHDRLGNFHNQLVMQAGAYQNATWVVGVAKAGLEAGVDQIGGSCIIAPTGEVVAQAVTEDDELVVARCDLDLGNSYRNSTFNFAKHREPQCYGMIVERKGAVIA